MRMEQLPVAIIGAGPIGMAAAAHLVKQNHDFILFEAGASVGTNFLDYSHVRLFSSWEYNIDSAARSLLQKNHISLPDPNKLPYGGEIVSEYLQPLSSLPELKSSIHLNSKVVHISRKGIDKVKTDGRELLPFIIQVENKDLQIQQYEAKAVIDATGTWHNPNPFISGGLNTPNPKNNTIHSGIPNILGFDKETFINNRVLVIGSGHSALHSILDLVKLKKVAPRTTISWIIRKPNVTDVLGGGSKDQLPERGALGTRVEKEISNGNVEVHVSTFVESFKTDKDGSYLLTVSKNDHQAVIGQFDHIISNTGSSPTFEFLKEIRYAIDSTLESVPELAPLIDPNVHSCGTVRPHGEKELRQPEKDFYIVGAKSYGRAPTFLMATGYEQVRSIVAHLSGDKDSAERVELHLPETGVCSLPSKSTELKSNQGSCCNG